MPDLKDIPVLDLFAGPGGLGEGFSSVFNKSKDRVFKIKLSIEKDTIAHKTLQLRSFYRSFEKSEIPEEYYKLLRIPDNNDREVFKKELFKEFSDNYDIANDEAWNVELGGEDIPQALIDLRIRESLGENRNWVLIGGPPCQAYSLAGRSRVGGISETDHRVYLYREYLRIIAKFHPAVFVMENVKGLLSASVNGEKVFQWMQRDLQDPSSVFPELDSPGYRIYSLTTEPKGIDKNGNPVYEKDSDYLIKSEDYSVPQKRHRVILLGIREDIDFVPPVLAKAESQMKLKDIIGDLPGIRSVLNRSCVGSKFINGKKKRFYKNIEDSDSNWLSLIESYQKEILTWNGFGKDYKSKQITVPRKGVGSEFVKANFRNTKNPLKDWFYDERLKGVCNHISRSHLIQDLKRYMFSSMFTETYKRFPRLHEYSKHSEKLMPDHKNADTGKFVDRFRVQVANEPATTVTCHISKDGHYFIHYDHLQCRSLTVREAARIQTFPDNYLFCGSRTAQYQQVGNAVPPYLAKQIADVVKEVFENINNE